MNLAEQGLDLINSPNKLHIPNGEGASKMRSKAKTVLSESINEVINVLDQRLQKIPIRRLEIILPSMSESLQARINAYEALSESVAMKNELCSIFILNNNQREDKFSFNCSFANLFNSFINMGSFSFIRGVIDIAEQKTLLETSGVAMIHKVTGNQDNLLSTMNTGIYTPLEPNKRVNYIGFSQPDTKETLAISNVTDVVGEPIDSFCGYGNEDTVLYLTGLSFPKTFIENLAAAIKAEQNRVQKVMEDDDLCMNSNINFLAIKPIEKKGIEKKTTMRVWLLVSANK